MKSLTCGFIGLGLIGGSIAKAIKAYKKDIQIIAYDINQDSLKLALSEGVIDKICCEYDETFSQCDYLFLCAPVSENDKNLKKLGALLSPDCILTDVGSVKNTTHSAINALGLDKYFIGGHPMAGSEKIGYANSNALLLENAYYILTPSAGVASEKVAQFEKFIENLGSIPLVLDETKHDYITAAISHLPHIIAAQLVNLIHDSDDEHGLMRLIAAGGFKDITRIASSSPKMWEAVCMTNTDNIKKLLKDYIRYMQKSLDLLEEHSGPNIHDMFASAKDYRDSFINSSRGPIKKVYAVHVDIPDVTGALARTATLLASADISIQNIGIMHNREFEEGALRIEFYDAASLEMAVNVLKDNDYKIYAS